jgi:23S rRNA pseudouridine2605 synthase
VSYDSGRGTEIVEFTSVEPAGGEGANLWYRVEIERADRRAGVRALFESRDLKVSRMTQVAFGGIELPRDLPRGRHRALTTEQVTALYALAQIPAPVAPAIKVIRDEPRTGRAIAPDRRQAKKRSAARDGADKRAAPDARYADHRAGKLAAKKSPPKKVSTWKIGGKKRPHSDPRR